jgi:hypothetical protein
LRVCFCGVVLPGALAAGSESRDEDNDDDEVRSEMVSAVVVDEWELELELAMALACGYPLAWGEGAVREGAAVCDGAPLFGGAG